MTDVGFRTALSALSAAQQALQVVSHNVANAGTPGYSRQIVQLRSRMPTLGGARLPIGTGVDLQRTDRVVDALLDARLRRLSGDIGRQTVLRDHLVEVESIFGEPDDAAFSATLSAFFAEISSLATSPEDVGVRTGMIQRGVSVADTLQLLRGQLGEVDLNLSDQIRTEVAGVNQALVELAELNDLITSGTWVGNLPPDLLDRQEQLLRELGERVDVDAMRGDRGQLTLSSGGQVLLTPRGANELVVEGGEFPGSDPVVRMPGAQQTYEARSGRLQALQELSEGSITERTAALDQLARNLILEFNRVHAVGVPLDGGFTELVGTNHFTDTDSDGSVLDEIIGSAGLPFELGDGALWVNVTDDATGDVTRTRIDVDPLMRVHELRDALNAVPDINASVDALGALRINSSAGHRFDFSNRLPPNANVGRSFGAVEATLTGNKGPYALQMPSSFTLSVNGGAPQSVNLSAGMFVNPAAATPAEVATAINGQITGATAEVVEDRVVIRSSTTGTQATLALTDGAGAPLAAMGLPTGTVSGGDLDTVVEVSGSYEGQSDRLLTFDAVGDGVIGLDPVQVAVRDATGAVLTTIDLGPGYTPGDPVEVVDGVSVSFQGGRISQSGGDRFDLQLVADSDTSDLLVATGLNAFFTGHDAATIGVSEALAADPRLLSAALSGDPGDNANLLALAAVEEGSAAGLDDLSPRRFYERTITDLGLETGRARSSLESQDLLMQALEAKREAVSGVNLDEELLMMEQFQQAYQAAARFLQTLQEVNDVLVNLVG